MSKRKKTCHILKIQLFCLVLKLKILKIFLQLNLFLKSTILDNKTFKSQKLNIKN